MRSTKILLFAITCICPSSPAPVPFFPACSGSIRATNTCERIEWMKNARRDIAITTDIIVGFPGETESDFEETLKLVDQVEYDSMFIFKYSKRPNTSALQYEDHIPEEEKTRRFVILQERQRAIQIGRNARYVGSSEEVHVEGYNLATGQWIGRTTQNKTLNFHDASLPAPGRRAYSGRKVSGCAGYARRAEQPGGERVQ